MIEVVGLGARETLAAAGANLAVRCAADAELLSLAVHWADLHSADSVPVPAGAAEARWRRLTGRHLVRLGGDGTPEVLNHPPAELGVILQSNAAGAKHLIADALDLRHRLPRLWSDVHVGGVRAWKARKVAAATRHLPLEVMADVDAGLGRADPGAAVGPVRGDPRRHDRPGRPRRVPARPRRRPRRGGSWRWAGRTSTTSRL